jgi:rare lipoprotein A
MRRFIVLFVALSTFGCAVSHRQVPSGTYRKPKVVLPEEVKPYSFNGVPYYPLPREHGFVQEGMASWYGMKFHRKRTASGEIFNMYDKTAAHRTLPLGTYVKVENLSNQREVVVRINDRGPFVKGRIIDLSYGAAKGIGLIEPGVTRVRLVALSQEAGSIESGDIHRPVAEAKDFSKGRYTVQVGAFEIGDNARRLAKRLKVIFDDVTVTTYIPCHGGTVYRVRVTTSGGLTEANQIVEKLEYLGFPDTFVVGL